MSEYYRRVGGTEYVNSFATVACGATSCEVGCEVESVDETAGCITKKVGIGRVAWTDPYSDLSL